LEGDIHVIFNTAVIPRYSLVGAAEIKILGKIKYLGGIKGGKSVNPFIIYVKKWNSCKVRSVKIITPHGVVEGGVPKLNIIGAGGSRPDYSLKTCVDAS
jgi:hypothetical protein